jgi:hypothetical protein
MPTLTEEPEGVAAFEHAEGFPDAFAEYVQQLGDRVTQSLAERIEKTGVKWRTITPSGNTAQEILNIAVHRKCLQ